ncbi:MAG TPA: DHHA1 domain-containing protein, partial [Candidatus Hypogeohydataceae bacterium YC38]
TQEEAKGRGAIALFGEKYGERVRLVNIGDYSLELCGGIHLRRTGEVGLFKVLGEGSVAAGIRRIEAHTGPAALKKIRQREAVLQELTGTLKAKEEGLIERVEGLLKEIKRLEKELAKLKEEKLKLVVSAGPGRVAEAIGITRFRNFEDVSGVKIATAMREGATVEDLRKEADSLRAQYPSIAIVLASAENGRVVMITSLSQDLVKKGLHAGEIAKDVAKLIGGGGGGKPDMAQAGGILADKLDEALDYSFKVIKEKVQDTSL